VHGGRLALTHGVGGARASACSLTSRARRAKGIGGRGRRWYYTDRLFGQRVSGESAVTLSACDSQTRERRRRRRRRVRVSGIAKRMSGGRRVASPLPFPLAPPSRPHSRALNPHHHRTRPHSQSQIAISRRSAVSRPLEQSAREAAEREGEPLTSIPARAARAHAKHNTHQSL
jgi:hypothetical protein